MEDTAKINQSINQGLVHTKSIILTDRTQKDYVIQIFYQPRYILELYFMVPLDWTSCTDE